MPSVIRGVDDFDSLESQGLGDGQAWQNVSRSANVTYTNTTGRPIAVMIRVNEVSGSILVDGTSIQGYIEGAPGTNISITFIVPNESTYEVTTGTSEWKELR